MMPGAFKAIRQLLLIRLFQQTTMVLVEVAGPSGSGDLNEPDKHEAARSTKNLVCGSIVLFGPGIKLTQLTRSRRANGTVAPKMLATCQLGSLTPTNITAKSYNDTRPS